MDEISKALHAAQMERRNHIASSFSNLAETAIDEEAIKKANDSEVEEKEEETAAEEEEQDDEEKEEEKEAEEKETEESDEADGGETEKGVFNDPYIKESASQAKDRFKENTGIKKSDIMYALGNGNIEITKSGKEIKEQVESVLLPELNANLAVKEAEATEKLGECGAAPTSDPDPWWTGDVKMDVGYKIYGWREMDFCKPESRMYDSLSASDEAEKKGNCPTSEAEAKARREYNDIVRAICNIRVDIKACEILKELKDNAQYKLTPRQVITLRF
jgi:hypothetical protein